MKKFFSIVFISFFIFFTIPNPVFGADRQEAIRLKELGNKAMTAGDDSKAVQLYIKSIKADPSYANSYNNIGMILDKKGDKASTAWDKRPSPPLSAVPKAVGRCSDSPWFRWLCPL